MKHRHIPLGLRGDVFLAKLTRAEVETLCETGDYAKLLAPLLALLGPGGAVAAAVLGVFSGLGAKFFRDSHRKLGGAGMVLVLYRPLLGVAVSVNVAPNHFFSKKADAPALKARNLLLPGRILR